MRGFRAALVALGLLLVASACSARLGWAPETTPQDITVAPHEHRWDEVIWVGPIQ
ncbi:MAG TPA: hypothetical protein VLT62_12025 [Candidatus Methylomirabilis sp.]|nr:hypothetical protein [Candidatus Methylomirabilis sp.]